MSQARATNARLGGESMALVLIAVAALTWWWTWRMAAGMNTDGMIMIVPLGAFLVGWAVMMAAMMLPAVTPVVRLYQRAAVAGRVAPTGYFVTSYLVVWALTGLPAYLLWQWASTPLRENATWAVRIGGVTLIVAGAYQLTPLKRACLRHCRSPMSYFLRLRGSLERPGGAVRAGLLHALYCCGCCTALMTVLVVTAAMNLLWAVLIALVVFVERNIRWGVEFATVLGVVMLALGAAVVVSPPILPALL